MACRPNRWAVADEHEVWRAGGDSLWALSPVSYQVIQSLKKLSEIGGLVACKERSVLQDQHLLLNPGLHFVSSGLRSLNFRAKKSDGLLHHKHQSLAPEYALSPRKQKAGIQSHYFLGR